MKKYLIPFLALLLCSCSEKYTYYIETENGERIVAGNSTIGENEVGNFRASSDSAAYLEGYHRLVLAQQVYNDLAQANLNKHGKPVRLFIFNEDGTEISNIDFATKHAEE